jgi:hypothetical protein
MNSREIKQFRKETFETSLVVLVFLSKDYKSLSLENRNSREIKQFHKETFETSLVVFLSKDYKSLSLENRN